MFNPQNDCTYWFLTQPIQLSEHFREETITSPQLTAILKRIAYQVLANFLFSLLIRNLI